LISLLVGRARDEQINPVAQVAPATARPVADVRNFMYTDYIKVSHPPSYFFQIIIDPTDFIGLHLVG
jgi:hypothetical protein